MDRPLPTSQTVSALIILPRAHVSFVGDTLSKQIRNGFNNLFFTETDGQEFGIPAPDRISQCPPG